MGSMTKSAIRIAASVVVATITRPAFADPGSVVIDYEVDLVCAPENEDPACITSGAVPVQAARDGDEGAPATGYPGAGPGATRPLGDDERAERSIDGTGDVVTRGGGQWQREGRPR